MRIIIVVFKSKVTWNTKYAKFRQYLHQFILSDNITQDNKMGLILMANIVIIDLAKKADVILITLNMVL